MPVKACPQPIFPRPEFARVSDPYFITRALEKAVKAEVSGDGNLVKEPAGDLHEYVDNHYVYNAFVLYNHYAGMIWAQGFPQKAITALRKAINLQSSPTDWMSILLRAKSQLNLAVFLSRGINLTEARELLKTLTGELVEHLEKVAAVITERREHGSKPMDEMFLEELVVLLCFSLHHEANLGFRSKEEAYTKCMEACCEYLDDNHPLKFLVTTELRRLGDASEEEGGFSSLVATNQENGGLVMPITQPVLRLSDEKPFTTAEPSVRPNTAPTPVFPKVKESNQRRPNTAPVYSRARSRVSLQQKANLHDAVQNYNCTRLKPSCVKLLKHFEGRRRDDNKDAWKENIECWDRPTFSPSRLTAEENNAREQRANAVLAAKKKEEAGSGARLKKENPFATWQDVVSTHHTAKEALDVGRSKVVMKKKSREFQRVCTKITSEDREELRNVKFYGVIASKSDTTTIQKKVQTLQKVMRESQEKTIRRISARIHGWQSEESDDNSAMHHELVTSFRDAFASSVRPESVSQVKFKKRASICIIQSAHARPRHANVRPYIP